MSDVPVCKIHQKPMRQGRHGGFYCANKMPSGEWCKERAPAPKPAASTPAAASSPGTDRIRLAVASLAFAGAVYHGAGEAGAQPALDLARLAASVMAGDPDVPNF